MKQHDWGEVNRKGKKGDKDQGLSADQKAANRAAKELTLVFHPENGTLGVSHSNKGRKKK